MTVQESKSKKPPVVANELLSKTFTLLSPIHVGDEVIKTITITEPLARQQGAAEREAKQHGHEIIALLLQISDLPKKAVKKLKLRDIGQIKRWLKAINAKALADDGLTLPIKAAPAETHKDPFEGDLDQVIGQVDEPSSPDVFESERLFKLSVPVNYDGRTVTELKAVEPDLEAATAAGRFQHDTEQTSAIVAVMSGESMPVIGRMAYRDLYRMEVWLIPLVENLSMEVAG